MFEMKTTKILFHKKVTFKGQCPKLLDHSTISPPHTKKVQKQLLKRQKTTFDHHQCHMATCWTCGWILAMKKLVALSGHFSRHFDQKNSLRFCEIKNHPRWFIGWSYWKKIVTPSKESVHSTNLASILNVVISLI